MPAILFVCTGNICRSPLAEGVLLHKLRQRGLLDRFTVDSAGTGNWHEGERPDPRTLQVAAEHGVDIPGVARQLRRNDASAFDLLIAMDRDHAAIMEREWHVPPEKIRLMRSYDPDAVQANALDVPDPYYGGRDGFERIYRMIDRACDGLVDELLAPNTGAPAGT